MSETLFFVPGLKGGCVAISGVMMDLGASGRDLDGTGFSSSLIPVDLNTEPLLRPSSWVIQTIQSAAVVCFHHLKSNSERVYNSSIGLPILSLGLNGRCLLINTIRFSLSQVISEPRRAFRKIFINQGSHWANGFSSSGRVESNCPH